MKLKKEWIIIGALVVCLLAGAGVIVSITQKSKTPAVDESTFAAKTDIEVFQTIPIMAGKNIAYDEARDVGDANYAIDAKGTTYEEYKTYLTLLEQNGFTKHVDNGEDGFEGNVYAAYYQKDKLIVNVAYMDNLEKTIISVSEGEVLTPNLFYDDSYVAGNQAEAKTKLHFPELYSPGNSFIFQLKNGNFIIEDGGQASELPYLLDYLESLAPEGQKPTVEAWFVSHSHADHMGVFTALTESSKDCKRVNVEGIYYFAPSREAQLTPAGVFDNVEVTTTLTTNISEYLTNSEGDKPPVYRTHFGDRLYFCDIVMDVIYSPELLDYDEWDTWNSSSTMYMHTIEGQKVLFTGDADLACQSLLMDIYDAEYFDLDVYQVAHHGKNVLKETANYFKRIDTLLYPTWRIPNDASEYRVVQNDYLQSFAKEALCWQQGTIVLTFPYSVGASEQLPPTDWEYNVNEPSWKAKLEQQ